MSFHMIKSLIFIFREKKAYLLVPHVTMELGQCKARPLKFHRVYFLFIFCLFFVPFFSAPTHDGLATRKVEPLILACCAMC